MIKTHKVGTLVSIDGFIEWDLYTPGAQVQLFNRSARAGEGYGIVIATTDDEMTVLWSEVPRAIRRSFPPLKGEDIKFIADRSLIYKHQQEIKTLYFTVKI